MRRAVHVAVALILAWSLVACGGGTFFISTNGHDVTFLSLSGTVSIVQLTIINGNVQVTVVTLIRNGSAITTNFCGDLVNQFPINSFVSVTFNQGTPCNALVQVVF